MGSSRHRSRWWSAGAPRLEQVSRRVLQRVSDVLDAVYLLDLTTPVLEQAAGLRPAPVRSLDAIHIATAISIGDPDLDVITYDDRMAEAARANGLRVAQPGR